MAKDNKLNSLTEKQLIDYVNNSYKNGKRLDTIAEELGSKKSTLSVKLKGYGYTFKRGAYIKLGEETTKNVKKLDTVYLATETFGTQLSARVNAETKSAFEQLCAEKYPNVPISKLVSMALKEFTKKHK